MRLHRVDRKGNLTICSAGRIRWPYRWYWWSRHIITSRGTRWTRRRSVWVGGVSLVRHFWAGCISHEAVNRQQINFSRPYKSSLIKVETKRKKWRQPDYIAGYTKLNRSRNDLEDFSAERSWKWKKGVAAQGSRGELPGWPSTVANHAWRMPDSGSNRVMKYAMVPWIDCIIIYKSIMELSIDYGIQSIWRIKLGCPTDWCEVNKSELRRNLAFIALVE